MNKLQAWIRKYPTFTGFAAGIIFAHTGMHKECYKYGKQAIEWGVEKIDPSPTLWDRVTFWN
jgi:hypothetical protein